MSRNFTAVVSKGEPTKRWAICKSVSTSERYRLIVPCDSVEVEASLFKAVRRDVKNFQRREMYYGRCNNSLKKSYLCTMDCFNCQFQKASEFFIFSESDDITPKKKSPFLESNDKLLAEEKKKKCKRVPKPLDASKLCIREPISPEAYAEGADNIERIIAAVSAMGPLEEEIILLLQQEYTHHEIIDELGIPRSTYYYTLSKIKNVVRQVTDIKICA